MEEGTIPPVSDDSEFVFRSGLLFSLLSLMKAVVVLSFGERKGNDADVSFGEYWSCC